MKINGMVCEFSGTVVYRDNSIGTFHAQGESPDFTSQIIWSIDQGESRQTLADIAANPTQKAAFGAVFGGGSSWNALVAPSGKAIADTMYHFQMVITEDNGNIIPWSQTYENGQVRIHARGSIVEVPDNGIQGDLFWLRVAQQILD